MSGKTGSEIVTDTFRHKTFERPAWIVYTGVHVGSLLGYSAEEILKNRDKLLASLLEAHKLYSPDGMTALFDLQLEAEILGCRLIWNRNAPPVIKTHPLDIRKTDFHSLPGKNEGRIPIVLDVISRLKLQTHGGTAIYGLVTGPLTLAFQLRGMKLFMDFYEDYNYAIRLLNYCTEINLKMAEYYIDAGADVIGIADPLLSLINPDLFISFLSCYYSGIFSYIRENKVFSSFIVYDNVIPFIREMAKTKPDCISVDENTDITEVRNITAKFNIVLSGNISLNQLMHTFEGSDSLNLISQLVRSMGNRNFMLAPGFDLPYEVPSGNIIAISELMQKACF